MVASDNHGVAEAPSGVPQDVAREAAQNVPSRPRGRARKPAGEHHSFLHSLMTKEAIPEYLADNPYILRFYRREQSALASMRTFFRIHNETGNVWTHFIGAPATRMHAGVVACRPTTCAE